MSKKLKTRRLAAGSVVVLPKGHRLAAIRAARPSEMQPIAFSAPVTIAAADGEDGKAKGPPRFSMIAYTGVALRQPGWPYPVVVDVKGLQFTSKPRPALRDHDPAKIVGHIDKIEVVDNQLTASGLISGTGPDAEEVRGNGLNGYPWQSSIGASPIKAQFIREGETAQANGKTFEGPCYIVQRASLKEISFVALGADDNTSAKIAAKNAAGETVMTFEQWLAKRKIDATGMSKENLAGLQAMYDAEIKATESEDDDQPAKKKKKKIKASAKAKADDEDDDGELEIEASDNDRTLQTATVKATKLIRAEHAKEMKRIAAVSKIAKDHPEIAAKAVEEAWDEQKTELEVLRAARPNHGPYVNTGAGAKLTNEIVAASVSLSAGVSEKVAFAGLSDNQKEIAASRDVRRAGIHQVMFMIAATAGLNITPGRIDEDSIRAMLRHDQRIEASGGFSTMSLSGILSNVQNKAMLEAYGSIDSVVPQIAYETDTNDFKPYVRYRLTGAGSVQAVSSDGELRNMSLQDESYSNKVGTVGAILAITREIIINDDMGALVQAPTLLGRQTGIAREKAVFSTLVGNAGSFFSPGNKNYISGGTSALSVTSLATARQKFMEQKDANGDPIMVIPDRILVPPALETTADNLFNGVNLIVGALGSTSSKSVEPNLNAHKGKYQPIVTPWLGAQSPVSGGSDTAFYLLANPAAGMAVVQVGYLRGQRTPTIERGEVDFNKLGIAMRCYFDFGVALHDNRCGVLSAGA